MTLLRPAYIDARRLTYDAATRTFTAEASDLAAPGRVWDDACDVGYTIVGRTAEVVFVEARHVRDGEGELLYTVYEPAADQRLGALRGMKFNVYND